MIDYSLVAATLGLEGIVSKRIDAPYRTEAWRPVGMERQRRF